MMQQACRTIGPKYNAPPRSAPSTIGYPGVILEPDRLPNLYVESDKEVAMTKYFAALLMFFVVWPSFAADLNGYTAQYECRAGGTYCNVDVASLGERACDQTIKASTPWSSINWSSNTICIEAGDHTSKGTLTIPSSANGKPGNYKVLRYYRAGDSDDEPWKQSAADQATLKRLVVTGSYWIIHRIRVARSDTAATETYNNNIWNRVLLENSNQRIFRLLGVGNTLQNSVVRYAGDDFTPGIDEHCVDTAGGDASNSRIVNNEIYNCTGDTFQNNKKTISSGLVLENNDLYVDSAYYAPAVAGRSCSEQAIDIKVPGPTSGNPIRIIHNRLWGFKRTDGGCGGSGSLGEGILLNGDAGVLIEYALIQNNIISDMTVAIAGDGRHASLIGNLIYNIHDDIDVNHTVKLQSMANAELYLNTIIKTADAWTRLDGTTLDLRCNAVIDTPPHYGALGSDSQVDYNVYYGVSGTKLDKTKKTDKTIATRANSKAYSLGDIIRTSSSPTTACTTTDNAGCFLYKVTTAGTSASSNPGYCTTLGCVQEDGSMQVRAVRGPYTFYRKLHTKPERYTIPYARAYAGATNTAENAPESFACPSDYSKRLGVGIN
jgi:hypothetical protein